jgi:hypothetical protein
MRKLVVPAAVLFGLVAAPVQAKVVDLQASPNPAMLRDRVRHTVSVGATGKLDVWVSASGFEAPGAGTLPPGRWTFECCPSQTAGTSAWHYRSTSPVSSGTYRFTAVTRARGRFLSTAAVGGSAANVWVWVR